MNIDNEIRVLDEQKISQIYEYREDIKKPEGGLVEQVIREDAPEKEAILVLEGNERIRITSFPFVIGKSRTADYTIEGDSYISRRHCRITQKNNRCYIEDLNSMNGTFIRGKSISEKTEIKEGMEIVIADRKYRARWEN